MKVKIEENPLGQEIAKSDLPPFKKGNEYKNA